MAHFFVWSRKIFTPQLNELLQVTVSGLGFELVDVELTPTKTMIIFIDKPDGVTIDDCEIVSNQLSKLFAVEEIDYNRLEVSSPGLDRPLKTLAAFERFIGRVAKIKTRIMLHEKKVFQGIIARVENDSVILTNLIDNAHDELTIAFTDIARARLVIDSHIGNLKQKGKK